MKLSKLILIFTIPLFFGFTDAQAKNESQKGKIVAEKVPLSIKVTGPVQVELNKKVLPGSKEEPINVKFPSAPEIKIVETQKTWLSDPNWWVAIMATLAAIIAAYQAWMFRRQLGYMQGGMKDTKEAAIAAKKSADALIDIDKAYVFPWHVEFRFSSISGSRISIGQAAVTYKFKNYGKTPAIIKQTSIQFLVAASMPEIPSYTNLSQQGEIVLGSEVATKSFRSDQIKITEEYSKKVETEDAVPVFYGFVRYQDIFNNEWIRGFCFKYDISTYETIMFGGSAYNYLKSANFATTP
jgi:hypothetical protein